MNDQVTQNPILNFIIKYKKWLIAAIGIQLIPLIIFICTVLGTSIYLFVNNDGNWHPYKSYIEKGYRAGLEDGNKDRGYSLFNTRVDFLTKTLWYKYDADTDKLKEQVIAEKEEYLARFSKDERGAKRAEMKVQGIKLPLELELEKRFTNTVNFYADYVKKKVRRDTYASDEEYKKALCDEAWKVGYEYGYGKGRM